MILIGAKSYKTPGSHLKKICSVRVQRWFYLGYSRYEIPSLRTHVAARTIEVSLNLHYGVPFVGP